jgi:hypothetical protein
MLLDTGVELNALHEQLNAFLASSTQEASFPADVNLSPAPHDEFLNGLRVYKAQGPLMLKLSSDRWLELSGAENNLAKYISHFHFKNKNENDHHHPDNANYMSKGSMCLIIEADSTWAECNERANPAFERDSPRSAASPSILR